MKYLLSNDKNYGNKRKISDIKYIVVHYTANRGDTAENNALYFKNNITNTSAHFFVDEKDIYQTVPPDFIAWHCGAKTYKNNCRNTNSLGVEMCLIDVNGNIRKNVIKKTIEFIKKLMFEYNVDIENVIRHFDVTGKACPAPFVANPSLWSDFKNDLREVNNMEKRYDTIEDIPKWAKEAILYYMTNNFISGDENGRLNLSMDMIRLLTVIYKALKKEG